MTLNAHNTIVGALLLNTAWLPHHFSTHIAPHSFSSISSPPSICSISPYLRLSLSICSNNSGKVKDILTSHRYKVATIAIILSQLLILSLPAAADGFAFIPQWGTDGLWLSAPTPDSTSQVWFRRQYIFSQRPSNAHVIIATTGYAELYVNGRNASKYVLAPFRTVTDGQPISTVYDVTRFINSDTVTLAVWYCPTSNFVERQQIAVSFSGHMPDGNAFSFPSDDTWLCRQAPASINAIGGETIDGRQNRTTWKYHNGWSPALWTGCRSTTPNISAMPWQQPCAAYYVNNISSYNYFDLEGDTIIYDFDKGFVGWVRVTFRDAVRGTHVWIGNNEYICNGTTDEQACPKFTITGNRKVIIYGDRKFRPEHIVNIEAINISSKKLGGWQPYY